MEENGGIEMIRLPKIFGKGCVLQQQVPTAFWGWAQPEENIRAWLTGDGQTIAEVQGKVKEERPDVIVPTGVLKDTLTDDVPVVVGTCFVTGVGEKATIDKILEILSK